MTQVPFHDRLDRSYKGILDGIEVVETAANNGRAFRNFTWNADGTISYQLYAKGSGTWIDPPKAFGMKVGGGYCHCVAGGSQGIEIYAHYRQTRLRSAHCHRRESARSILEPQGKAE